MLAMHLRVEVPDFVNDLSQETGFDINLLLPYAFDSSPR
jgi:hypothetical protein